MLLFFFYCYGHPRDLHSFPTRRSSDLIDQAILAEQQAAAAAGQPHRCELENGPALALDTARRLACDATVVGDRKSTRLNSSHGYISYAVFCLKKKKKKESHHNTNLYHN